MRFNYDAANWEFVARILEENGKRLSRTRGGESDTSTNGEKSPLLLQGDALRQRSAENERRVQRLLFETRHAPAPQNGQEVLELLWTIADMTNAGLLGPGQRLRHWPSHPHPPAPPERRRLDAAELPAALEQFADEVYRRWGELASDPVPLASWAEWELNGGSLRPFYHGCGRISRAFGALLLLRASWLLPLYEDRESYFEHGHRGPVAFVGYVSQRIEACARWLRADAPTAAEQPEIEELPLTWDDVARELAEVKLTEKEFATIKKSYFDKGAGRPGDYFFRVRYRPGTAIMIKGTTSDFAAIHLRGRVRILNATVQPRPSGQGCWEQPRLRRLENIVVNNSSAGDKLPATGPRWLVQFYLRFPGVPLGMIDFARRFWPRWESVTSSSSSGGLRQRARLWLRRLRPRWGHEAWANRLEQHVACVLRGRLPRINRSERRLSRPRQVVDADAPSIARPQLAPRPTNDAPSEHVAEKIIEKSVRDSDGKPLPLFHRFMGITGALWGQPRSVTLVAADDPDDPRDPADPRRGGASCEMLLIKRRALEGAGKTIGILTVSAGKEFLSRKLADFVNTALPDLLADNRLFRDTVYLQDVADWPALLAALQGAPPRNGTSAPLEQLTDLLDDELKAWLGLASAGHEKLADQSRMISSLNRLLASRALTPPDISEEVFAVTVREEARRILQQRKLVVTDCETFRLNRLLFESLYPDVLHRSARPSPLWPEEFQRFVKLLADLHKQMDKPQLCPEPWQPYEADESSEGKDQRKVKYIFKQGDEADAFYLILSGLVSVTRNLPGGEAIACHLDSGGYFGESALLDAEPSTEDAPAKIRPALRSGNVRALCKSYLLRLDRDVLKRLQETEEGVWLLEKLRRERQRVITRNALFDAGWLLPSRDPPPQIADRLVLTQNVLLIDMDRCTRCDQCVKGCAAAHDMQPRFHRANPELRFGKWEVAAACLHCLDAPCLESCPVGAITFLDDKAVQIHRDRCIGCRSCEKACPFGVIDMLDTTAEDAPNSKKQLVANKCDLCLDEHHDPPCVAWCPYDAAMRVDPAVFFQSLKGRGTYTVQLETQSTDVEVAS